MDNELFRHISSIPGSFQKLKELLDRGANPNATQGPYTALGYTLVVNKLDMAKLLIEYGADPNPPYYNYYYPLSSAVRLKKIEFVRLFLNAGARPDGGQVPPIFYALDSPEILKMLIDAGANVNIREHPAIGGGSSVLEKAVLTKNPEVVRTLLNAGANPSLGKVAPIIHAFDSPEIMKILIDSGADMNVRYEPYNVSILEKGVLTKNPEVVRTLLKAGADPNAGLQAPIFHALDSPEIMKILVDGGADVNVKFGFYTVLQKAVSENKPEAVRILLKAGANSETLDRICQSRNIDMVHVFIDFYLEHERPLTPDVIDKAKAGVYLPEINTLILDYERRAIEKRRKPLVNAWVRRHHAPGNNTRKAQLEEQVGNLLKYKTANEGFAAAMRNVKLRRSRTRRPRKSRR